MARRLIGLVDLCDLFTSAGLIIALAGEKAPRNLIRTSWPMPVNEAIADEIREGHPNAGNRPYIDRVEP